MTIHAGGSTIWMSEINAEMGYSPTAPITLNDAAIRALLGKPSGAISLSDAYGKSNRVTINLTAGGVNNYNIFSNRGGTYVAGKADIVLTVSGTIGSTAVATPALDTGTGWTAGDTIKIINNGTIIGCTGTAGANGTGGAGGRPLGNQTWANAGPGSGGSAGGTGGTGGSALYAQFPVSVTNNASIIGGSAGAAGQGGGGGGGGSNCMYTWADGLQAWQTSGSAQWGGNGQGPSAATAGGTYVYVSGGAGGAYGAAGGAGGVGRDGSNNAVSGSGVYDIGRGGAGGPAGGAGAAGSRGNYIAGNGYVTWLAAGTRTGSAA